MPRADRLPERRRATVRAGDDRDLAAAGPNRADDQNQRAGELPGQAANHEGVGQPGRPRTLGLHRPGRPDRPGANRPGPAMGGPLLPSGICDLLWRNQVGSGVAEGAPVDRWPVDQHGPPKGIPWPRRGSGEGRRLMASIAKRPDGAYRARYYDPYGKQHAKHFRRKTDAQQWLDRETAKLVSGAWVDPKAAKITEAFGARRLDSIRPSEVKSWTAALHTEGLADSYIYALHARLAQVLSDAVHDGVLTRSAVSRRTSPKAGKQRPYVASTERVWELHDAMGERYRAALLLAAFAGLRLAEVCGLRLSDVDFMRGIVSPVQQYPADPLKTEMSRTPIPIPSSLALALSAHVAKFSTSWIMCDESGQQMGPWQLQREFR